MNKLTALAVLATALAMAAASLISQASAAPPIHHYRSLNISDIEETRFLSQHEQLGHFFDKFCLESRDFVIVDLRRIPAKLSRRLAELINRDPANSLEIQDNDGEACETILRITNQLRQRFEDFKQTRLGDNCAQKVTMEEVPCVASQKVLRANELCSSIKGL